MNIIIKVKDLNEVKDIFDKLEDTYNEYSSNDFDFSNLYLNFENIDELYDLRTKDDTVKINKERQELLIEVTKLKTSINRKETIINNLDKEISELKGINQSE